MKHFTFPILFFFALVVQGLAHTAKITDVVFEYINPKYIETKLWEVKVDPRSEGNTYTGLDLFTHVVKDFPQDTKVLVRLYLVNSEGKKIKLLYSSRILLCKGDENYDYLPSFFKMIQSRSKCITKGQYQIKNVKDFNYANLIPDLDKKGQYFKLEFTVYSFWTGRILKGYNLIKSSVEEEEQSTSTYEQQEQQQTQQQQQQQQPQQQQQQHQQSQHLQGQHQQSQHQQHVPVKDNTYVASANSYSTSSSNYSPNKSYGQANTSGQTHGSKY